MWLPGYQSSMLCLGQHQRSRLIMAVPLHKPHPQKRFLQRTPFCWSLPSHNSTVGCTQLHQHILSHPIVLWQAWGHPVPPLQETDPAPPYHFCDPGQVILPLTASLAPHSPAPWLSFYLLYTRMLSFIHAHHQLFPVNKGWYQLLLMQKLSEGTTIGSD
jgi:hypothetical protein